MQDVPSPPEEVNVSDIFDTNCKVSWKPPTDDGGSPLTHYIIEKQDISLKAGWESVGQVKANEPTSFKVEGLTPKKEYRFRIRAVNHLGTSEAAQFGRPVLIKNPWGNLNCSFTM